MSRQVGNERRDFLFQRLCIIETATLKEDRNKNFQHFEKREKVMRKVMPALFVIILLLFAPLTFADDSISVDDESTLIAFIVEKLARDANRYHEMIDPEQCARDLLRNADRRTVLNSCRDRYAYYNAPDEVARAVKNEDEAVLKSVRAKIVQWSEGSVGVITIRSFSKGVADTVYQHLLWFRAEQIHDVIFDLRDNNGGLFYEAVRVLALFAEKQDHLFVLHAERNGERSAFGHHTTRTFAHRIGAFKKTEFRLIVLVDSITGSAAELTAAVLKSFGAVIVGERTWGKGSVVQVWNLPNGGQVRYTLVECFALADPTDPTKDLIQIEYNGVHPHIHVVNNVATEGDEHMQAARMFLYPKLKTNIVEK